MKRIRVWIGILLLIAGPLPAQRIREMEFKNQAVTDILLALGEMAGRSIVPDETVTGTASYYFTDTDFDSALKVFLSTYKMYSWSEGNVYYVSRVRAAWNREAGTATVDAEDVEIRLILRALSKAMGRTILFDALPKETITVHMENAKPDRILETLVKRFPEYLVESAEDFLYVKRVDSSAAKQDAKAAPPAPPVALKDGFYSIQADKVRLRDLLVELFRLAGVEYSLFLRSDAILENLHFSGKGFGEALGLVLEQANADVAVENGIYYVFDIQRADVMKKLKTVKEIPLNWLSVQDLPNLFPQDMAAQNLFRLDKNSNTVILSGSAQEIGPVEEFIRSLDRPLEGRSYCRFDLNWLKVSEVASILPASFGGAKPVALPQGNSFVLPLTEDGRRALEEWLAVVDRKQEGRPVRLQYIQAETLLKNLPPSVTKDDVVQTADANTVFFTGSEEKRKQFLRELSTMDRPIPQIRYDLLVIQYQGGDSIDWSLSLNDGVLEDATQLSSFLGSIGELFSLNFDIVSTFGYLFALDLSLEMGNNKASVLADTTVNGLSGQEIKFQNTDTYRYREAEVDEDTGETTYTGVTREITSGLIIAMNGWVSGDGMITMKVSSTVSKRGTVSSTDTATLPPTSERVVSTNVRTVSGKPVVIGGLMQKDTSEIVSKIPLLGDIPLLGRLFQGIETEDQDTELVIYIVPHVEYPDGGALDASRRMEELYNKHVKGATR